MSEPLEGARLVSARPRLGELDGLRGIAAVGVVIYHYTKFIADDSHSPRPHWLDTRATSWLFPFEVGSHGVALFFVISGFVIFMTLERTTRALDFVISRLSRLYPAFWCGIVVTTIFKLLFDGAVFSLPETLANVTMFAEPLGYPFTDGVYWTLVVEMKFYALMLALWWLGVLGRVELVCLAWFAALVAYRVALKVGLDPAIAEPIADALILKHIPLFAAGMMFFSIYKKGVTRERVLIIVLALVATWASGNVPKAIVATLAFGAMSLLCAGRLAPLGQWAVLRWLGDRSYTLYLVHMTIGFILIAKLSRYTESGWLLFAVPATLSLVLADAMHRLVEKPSLVVLRGAAARLRSPPAPEALPRPTSENRQ